VTISDKTLKIVWSEAGGRCSICRILVLTPGTEADDPSVFGELAHIVAKRMGGPRAGGLDEDKLDRHENLMLLCNKHHKQIDDQPNHFTVERLRQIKRDHAEWVASHGEGSRRLRLVSDPSHPEPKRLNIVANGHQLWPMIQECKATKWRIPDRVTDEETEDLMVEFLDTVKEYADISEDLHSVRDHRDAAKALSEYIRQLAERGYLVGAFMRRLLLTGGTSSEPCPWGELIIEIQGAEEAQIVDADGKQMGTTVGPFARKLARLTFLRWLDGYASVHPGEPAPLTQFFDGARPPAQQEHLWRSLIRGLHNEGLILAFESLDFWSSSATLTDKGSAELENSSPDR
jgi:HNH endonuclease